MAIGAVLGFFLWAIWAVVLTRGTIAQWTHDVEVLIKTTLGMLLLLAVLIWTWQKRDDILRYIEAVAIRVTYFRLLRAGEADELPVRSALEIGTERQRIMWLLYYNRGWRRGVDLRRAGSWKASELEWLVEDLIDAGLLVADPAQAPRSLPVRHGRAQTLIEFVDAVNLRHYSLTSKGRLYFERLSADAYRHERSSQMIYVLGNLNQIQVGTYLSEQIQMWIDGNEES